VYPRRVPDLYADRPLVLHGRYAGGGAALVTVRGRIAGRPFTRQVRVELPRGGPPRPEVESLWARARIRDLMTEMALRPTDALREEVTRVGLEHSLLTQWTAFIAVDEGATLPSAFDYGGDARRVGSTAGYGGLSLSGTGYGGGGTGSGTIGVGSYGTFGRAGGAIGSTARPSIRASASEVLGGLGREVIRRVIRRQLAAIRDCYARRLATHPDLAGRVVVEFVVNEEGAVERAAVVQSGLGDDTAEQCIVGVVSHLTFPTADGGGSVTVRYPFVFTPPPVPRYQPGLRLGTSP